MAKMLHMHLFASRPQILCVFMLWTLYIALIVFIKNLLIQYRISQLVLLLAIVFTNNLPRRIESAQNIAIIFFV